MKKLLMMFMLVASLAPLTACVVVPAHPVRPYAGAVWVPGHYGPNGYWIRGHYA